NQPPRQYDMASLMRNQLLDHDFILASLANLRPELRDALADIDLVFLQCMKKTRAADPFRRRPDQDERVSCPRFFTTPISKAAAKSNNRFSVLPDRYRRAHLAELLEIFSKQPFQSLNNSTGFQLH